PHWTARLGGEADETVGVDTPDGFYAVGQFYRDFPQTPDDEVIACLDRSRAARDPVVRDEDVRIPVGGATLAGRLAVPEGAAGLVLFAHGSGSSRHSPRNRTVAAELNRAGLGTLLFDLLSEAEAADRAHVFDTPLLAGRLAGATEQLAGWPGVAGLPLGYFGASTGAAAALWAAGDPASPVAAVVSRG
ncbi:phosphoribosyltransferase, partial [Streptomyces sp. SID2131]|nr:phosphoribosyltransferase [Streptomyces sp. SID2131]